MFNQFCEKCNDVSKIDMLMKKLHLTDKSIYISQQKTRIDNTQQASLVKNSTQKSLKYVTYFRVIGS